MTYRVFTLNFCLGVPVGVVECSDSDYEEVSVEGFVANAEFYCEDVG